MTFASPAPRFAVLRSWKTAPYLVQLEARADQRGRVLGAYSMFGPGMQTFSGVTVGVLGTLVGIPVAVVIGGVVLAAGAALAGPGMARGPRA